MTRRIGLGYFIGVNVLSFFFYSQFTWMGIFSGIVGFGIILCLPFIIKRENK
ncbi:hypothetical protein N0O92_09400 [Alkalihalobacillus sp. MEB130]|uniref:hypothetical protein n=1 Tax=Alkalihalobacillus sp. MEB130 TaxID=2976704 RepID=UPI0028DE9C01|nr:hypothetical protein [Alkalihalobacillus sp. MEB130]MDT8860450.1 hypothetical protein [Alkalihalobacillus sp. MEB130]